MQIRTYDKEKDGEAIKQMWIESGWGEYKDHERLYIESQRTIVATIDDQALALAVSSVGDIRYLDENLPLSGIGAVITDLTARKLKLSSRLTAHRVALDAMEGALVCGLGAFEDGYYNRLGFGTGCYEHLVYFAPSDLQLEQQPRRPRRLKPDDWEIMHRNRLQRRQVHGSCSFHEAVYTQFESGAESSAFRGCDSELPTLEASVGAFTRLWLGAHSARRLGLCDDFAASAELIEQLGWAFRLPEPWTEWEF